MYLGVALLSPPYSTLTYLVPPECAAWPCRPGLRVAVPLGRGEKGMLRAGVVLSLSEQSGLPAGTLCKSIIWPLEIEPLLSAELLTLAEDLALRQGVTTGHILGHVLPQGLRTTNIRVRRTGEGAPVTLHLKDIRAFSPEERMALARDTAAGTARMLTPGADAAGEEFCILRVDPPWPLRPSAARRLAVLEYLHEHGAVSRRQLLQRLGPSSAAPLRGLIKDGYLALRVDGPAESAEDAVSRELLPPPSAPFILNADQSAALEALRASLAAEQAVSTLLFGVTGSGKTAVYLELAKSCLERGKSMLLLAPEVALAHKLRRDAALALPDAPLYLYHGYQSPGRREALFRELAGRTAPCLIVGTRSALFLPVPNLGCVVLDEEHDGSFKQDESLSYQAKEVAWFRVAQRQGLLLLGSATPDLKTFHAATSNALPLLRLPSRVGNRSLPPVELVDISGLSQSAEAGEGGGLLAPQCEAALREVVAKGEQAVVLLNRRGYAPLMYCLDCKATLRCPHCEIGLTYHKGREKLICHYCGYSRPFPSPCPECKASSFLPLGEGTERLAERLSVLAGRPVLRLDRDSTRRPGRMEEILAAFARQESPILVGTQMLSKGHHFPQVTLAVVADGDLGLNLPDYRAAERTFQLLVQSAGRAGRGEKPGRVLIQTRDTRHYCWQYVQHADYEGFFADELARRRIRRYPPFVRLALIRMSYAVDDSSIGPAALLAVSTAMRTVARGENVTMLGPAPAPLAVLRGRRRFHCLLKGQDWQALRRVYFAACREKNSATLRLFLDLDPLNML